MNDTQTKKLYMIHQSISYILSHLNGNLTVEMVAQHFHYSKYYFSRLFKEVTSESPYSFIKRQKLVQSAIDVKLKKEQSITDIGLDYGYSTSNYSTAFKEQYHISPSDFRKSTNNTAIPDPFSPGNIANLDSFDVYNQSIELKTFQDFPVVLQRYIGNYHDIRDNWISFLGSHESRISEHTLMIERYYDDPSITDTHHCIYDLCLTIDVSDSSEENTIIAGGRFAVFHYSGQICDIFSALQGVFSVWLPESGYVMDQRYGFNIYREVDFARNYVVMDLCIPILEDSF